MLNNIGPYKILREISSGGMASVYLAQNIKNNQYVAIKILHERLLSKEKIYKRFTQEGLLNLNHKNIVKVFDIGVSNTGPYLVMEYVDGIDLEEYIKRSGKLEIQKVLNIFYQLLSALTYVHRIGIIHRDIKPKNILIDKNGVVKLTDFGIAKLIYSHIETSTGGYLGAPAYSSPEQMNGEDVDNRSDIYSLGVTLYQMLAGVSPFANDSLLNLIKRKFEKRYEPITKYRNDIPYNLISIINRCIEVNPKDRPKSVNEIASILNDMKDTVIIERPGRKIQKRFNLAIIISVTVVLFITFIFYIFIISEKTKNISEEKRISMTENHEETTLIETTAETSEVSVIISEETSEIIEIETIAVETTSVSSESETNIAETIPESAIIENKFSIGNTGPAGGLIFYINENYINDGWQYLEAAPNDQSIQIQWYNGEFVITGATATAVGTGKNNTLAIINIQGAGKYAAQLCSDLIIGEYSDWFLPSRDELNLLYINLKAAGLGDFDSEDYWSSSENDASNAWFQYFDFGSQYYYDKDYFARVRAIRAF